jgi:transcriptional regulator with XRE-family HTH domain
MDACALAASLLPEPQGMSAREYTGAVGARLRAQRRAQHLDQAGCARAMGWAAASSWCRLEQGQRDTASLLVHAAAALQRAIPLPRPPRLCCPTCGRPAPRANLRAQGTTT